MNILIANATGYTNIGDQAILFPLINLVKKSIKNSFLIVHTSEKETYKASLSDRLERTIYEWAVFEKRNIKDRLIRMNELILCYLSLKLQLSFRGGKELKKLINDYLSADLIIFVGGGYLRSQKGLKQSLNLFMNLLMFQYAKLSKAKKIVAPISFGPFAYKWQEKYAAGVLRDLDLVSVREEYSYKTLKKYKINNLIKSVDFALLMDVQRKEKKDNGKFILGFTIRQWFPEKEQFKFENNFAEAITNFVIKTNFIVQPIVQVDAPEYGDIDLLVTKRVIERLNTRSIKVLKIKIVESVEDGINIYSEVDLLLGMRMHSNILAALSNTPFVAISYEYKTEGIAKDLGVKEYCLKVEDVTERRLTNLLIKAYEDRVKITNKIFDSLLVLKQKESQNWREIINAI